MIGRTLVLLLLIIVLSVGGIFWFDYLNVIDAKGVLAPIYRFLPFTAGDGRSQPRVGADEFLNLDAERLAIRLEAIDLFRMELDIRQRDLDSQHGEIIQMAQELEVRQRTIEDIENSLIRQAADAENRDRNVEQFARYLNGMPPRSAVSILDELDDQNAIDILRKTEEIAQAEGTASIVSFWLSLMNPARAAELQRKMADRPFSL